MPYAVYILSNKTGSVLYTGFSSDLAERIVAHRDKLVPGFTARYNVDRLIYYETTDDRETALAREKQIKSGSRATKLALINETNPEWRDLSTTSNASPGRCSEIATPRAWAPSGSQWG